MKHLEKISSYVKLYLATFALTVVPFSGVFAQAPDELPAPEHRLGLRENTPAEEAWMKKNFPKTKKVRPNKLALDRVNAERESKGLPHLKESDVNLAPIGEESDVEGAAKPGSGGTTTTTTTETTGTATATPSSVDNSTLPAFPPVGRQLVGSCVAYATTYYQFTHETALVRGWNAKTGGTSFYFSPKWTYNMINNGVDQGSGTGNAYPLLLNHGAATWADFPDSSNFKEWCLNTAAWRKAIQFRLSAKGTISDSNTSNMIAQMKQQIANGHVLVFGTFVNSWVQTIVGNDPSTTLDDAFVGQKICSYRSTTNNGGHAMTFVGYNDNIWCDLNSNGIVDAGEKGAFKVANSWGTGDWNGGYRWVTYDALRATTAVAGGPSSSRTCLFQTVPGGVYWVTAQSNHIPTLLAEFTVNHVKRGQLKMVLGMDDTSKSIPAYQLVPNAINLQGGDYGFAGTTNAVDGTFVMDFSNLNPPSGVSKKYFLSIYDSLSGSAATLKSFKLTDASGAVVGTAIDTPKTADASQAWSAITYTLSDNPNYAPTAAITATPTTGTAPLVVSFNGSGSSDLDGSIASYSWNFGDGTTSSSAVVSHTYSSAGTFMATLTVADNEGATGSATKSIVVSAPANQAPTVATAAKGTPSPVLAKTTILSVLGADDAGEAGLTYTWTTTGTPPAPVSFSANGSNAAKNTTATFTKAGNYSFIVTIKDAGNLTATSSTTVSVNQTVTTVAVSPTTSSVSINQTQQFTATSQDQFGNSMTPTFAWTVSGGGTISSTGLFTAGAIAGGPFTVTASSGGKSGTASVTLSASVKPVVRVKASTNGAEPATNGAFQFSLPNGVSGSPVIINYTVAGTAIAGSDYTALSGSVTIPAGTTVVTVSIVPKDDLLVEGQETVVATITASAAYDIYSTGAATSYIHDNEKPTITLGSSNSTLGEPSDPAQLKFVATPAPTTALTVNYTMSGTAVSGVDYVAPSGSVVIAAGATSALVDITPIDDSLVEGKETVMMRVSASANYTGTPAESLSLYDDELPIVNVTGTDKTASEAGSESGVFTFTRTGSTSSSLTVTYTMVGSAVNGTDYNALPLSVVIPAGAASTTVTLTPINDTLIEGTESAQIRTASNAAYQIGVTYAATVSILDND
jgi:hypothetical protein